MGKNLNQVPTQATSILANDKMYIARSPFGATDDRYILGSDIIAQLASPLTTKGDLYTFSTQDARLAVGTVDGQILQVNSSAATGLAWSSAVYPATTTINQLLYSSAANQVTGLATANNGVLITSVAGVPSISSTLPNAVQDNITRLGTITSGVWNGTKISIPFGGTDATSFTAYMPVCGGTTSTSALQSVSTAGAVAGYALTYVSNAALPTWQAVGAAYTASALTKTDDTNVTLTLGGTPATALLQAVSLTLGWTGLLGGARGGTGVNNGTNTATYAGNLNFAAAFTTSGAFAVTQNYTAPTNVTFPTSGTLATTSQLPTPAAMTKVDDTNVTLTLGGTPATSLLQAVSLTMGWTGQLGLTRGGTNASLTAANGGIVYSTASALAISANTATANQMLQSGSTTTPTWSTTTWPATSTAGRILYSTFNNTIGELTTTASAVLTSSAASVPTWTAGSSSGDVLTYNGTIWTSAAPAAATTTAITNDTTTNASMFPVWVTANTGNLPLKVTSTKLFYNPSTSLLTNIGALGQITDIRSSAGLICLAFGYTASSVNYLSITNNATGQTPAIDANGSDSAVGISIRSKNSSINLFDNTSTIAPTLRFYNAAGNHYTGLKVATSASADLTLVLPSTDGSSLAPLVTDASGNLSFLAGAWVDWSGTIGFTGFSSNPTGITARYKKIGNTCFINIDMTVGTSNATSFTITGLPFTAQANTDFCCRVQSTTTIGYASGNVAASSTTITMRAINGSTTGWTNSGNKGAWITFTYETT